MQKPPRTVKITLGLILLDAIIWLGLGVLLVLDAHPAFPDQPLVRAWMAVLSIAAGCVVLVLLRFLAKPKGPAYFGMLGVLVAAALAVFLDDIGLVDLVVLLMFLIPLVLLIKDRAWFTRL